jgi:hypothetical protein
VFRHKAVYWLAVALFAFVLLGLVTAPAAFAGHCVPTQNPTCAHLAEPELYQYAPLLAGLAWLAPLVLRRRLGHRVWRKME